VLVGSGEIFGKRVAEQPLSVAICIAHRRIVSIIHCRVCLPRIVALSALFSAAFVYRASSRCRHYPVPRLFTAHRRVVGIIQCRICLPCIVALSALSSAASVYRASSRCRHYPVPRLFTAHRRVVGIIQCRVRLPLVGVLSAAASTSSLKESLHSIAEQLKLLLTVTMNSQAANASTQGANRQ